MMVEEHITIQYILYANFPAVNHQETFGDSPLLLSIHLFNMNTFWTAQLQCLFPKVWSVQCTYRSS